MKVHSDPVSDIDDGLQDLRQMTILGIRVLDGLGPKFHMDYEEASQALSFCLHDILIRMKKLEDSVKAGLGSK